MADTPTTAPSSQPAVISPGDQQSLDASMGKEAIVEGVVSQASWSSSGKVFLIRFQDADTTEFTGAIFSKNKDAMEKALGGELTATLQGAKVQIHGKLKEFRDHPEMLLDTPDQIVIVTKAPPKPATTEPQTAE